MSEISKVSVRGPVSAVREDLVREFTRLGYAPSTTARHLQQLAHLSRWMVDHQLGLEHLSWADIEVFCSDRGLSCIRRSGSPAIRLLMKLCRPECTPPTASTRYSRPEHLRELLADFSLYLRTDRALADKTIVGYQHHCRMFIGWYARRRGDDLDAVTIDDIDKFLISVNDEMSAASARGASVALRALFSWMFLVNRLDRDLAAGIVPGRHQLHTSTVVGLPPEDVEKLLVAWMSARDRAIILLLARLGLRAGEVAGLCLEDFDWRAATVKILGKGTDWQLMPVPAEIGEALAGYLAEHRPATSVHREVFLSIYPPIRPLSRGAVTMVVKYVAYRAGIEGKVGPHRLRHSAATAVIGEGGTLSEAGQLLRHRSSLATAIYARADRDQLVHLIRPWPVGQEDGS